MKLRPLPDRVVNRRAEGGVVIPDTATVRDRGENLLIMKEADITGIVEKTEASAQKAA